MFIEGTAKNDTALVNEVQSLARLIASNAVATSPPAANLIEYAFRSSLGRSSGDNHDGGASQSRSSVAKIGPLRVFHTSNGNGVLRPRTGIPAEVIWIGIHSP